MSLKSADKSINFKFGYFLNNFDMSFCDSPLGRDKYRRSILAQFTFLSLDISGNFFLILLSKKLIFLPIFF